MGEMGMNETSGVLHRHSDILEAQPTDASSFHAILNELKQRGNLAFSHRLFEEANVLYSQGIELYENPKYKNYVEKEDEMMLVPTFYSNRSATLFSMTKYKEALKDAIKSVEINDQWYKGYFRQAQVYEKLKEYEKALRSMDRMYAINSKTKEMKANKEFYQLLKDSYQEWKAKPHEVKEKKSIKSEGQTIGKNKASAEKVAKSTVTEKSKVTDEDLSNVRGYKKLADGRVTTYFNNDLTEEEKLLIGDITPKKIDNIENVTIKKVEGGSAWNQGNTFEEKDMTSWAKEKIKKIFGEIKMEEGNKVIEIEELKDLNGDAAIAVMRGSKRYIFEFTFNLKCKFDDSSSEAEPIEATVKVLDFSSDCDEDYDFEFIVPNRYTNPMSKACHEFLSQRFRSIFSEKARFFLNEFHSY